VYVCVYLVYVDDCPVVLLSFVGLAFGDHGVTGLVSVVLSVGLVLERSVHQPVFQRLFSEVHLVF
jgi:hypothetical protein